MNTFYTTAWKNPSYQMQGTPTLLNKHLHRKGTDVCMGVYSTFLIYIATAQIKQLLT